MDLAKDNRWWIFIGGSLMIFLANVDATIVNLALATIAKDLHTNLSQIQWVINAYLLTTVIFFIIGGKLSDILSLKQVFLVGTVFFGIGSLMAGMVHGFVPLIIARLIQGIGFAFTLSLALLMISNAFPPEQRGFALGLSVTITGLGQAMGPTIGGAILDTLNWHWIFLINIPFAILSFIIILIYGGKRKKTDKQYRIDYIGAIIFGIGLALLLLTFSILTHEKIDTELFSVGLILSLIVLAGFYVKEMRTDQPLVEFRLFAQRNYGLSIGVRAFYMYLLGSFLFFIPLFLQNILGFSPLMAGLIMLVYSAVFGICSPIAGICCDQVGYKKPIIFSGIICILSFMLLASTASSASIYVILLGLSFFGLSAGVIIPATVNSTITSLPKENSGEGIGMFFTVAFTGTSLGVAISCAIINLVSAHGILLLPADIASTMTPAASDLLHRVATGTLSSSHLLQAFDADQYPVVSKLAKQSFTQALSFMMWVNAGLALLMTLLSLALKNQVSHSELKR